MAVLTKNSDSINIHMIKRDDISSQSVKRDDNESINFLIDKKIRKALFSLFLIHLIDLIDEWHHKKRKMSNTKRHKANINDSTIDVVVKQSICEP